jgi:hypothetical protein
VHDETAWYLAHDIIYEMVCLICVDADDVLEARGQVLEAEPPCRVGQVQHILLEAAAAKAEGRSCMYRPIRLSKPHARDT